MTPNNLTWLLDSEIVFLNHGSFGSCPQEIHDRQTELRRQFERAPIRFVLDELEPLLDAARTALAEFVGADVDGLVLVRNATEGVNTVLRSLDLRAGDEILTIDHAYNACLNAARVVADKAGASVVLAALPFPGVDEDTVVERILGAVSPRTRVAMIDHATSPTGMVLPVARLVAELQARGVPVLVDGAHGPGMVPLDLTALGAAWYTGNCHKWMCGPKGAAFLHVREDLRPSVRPLVISHGANVPRTDRSRMLLEFDWTGTADPAAHLCLPDVIARIGGLDPGGWPGLMARSRALALRTRDRLCAALDIAPPCPDTMVGTMAAVPLPPSTEAFSGNFGAPDPLYARLRDVRRVEVALFGWPAFPERVLRISCAPYTTEAHIDALFEALAAEHVIPAAAART